MGMDVYGLNPLTETGEYFRNNVWWWRPLWNYCLKVAPEICNRVAGHVNEGDGLNSYDAVRLADILLDKIESGHTHLYMIEYNDYIASLPREDCNLCNSTGIRTDQVGLELGFLDKELDPEIQILTGRTYGYCNGCKGIGNTPHWESHYPFHVENVRKFAQFCSESGGFQIC